MDPWHGFVDPLLAPNAPAPDSPYVGERAVRDTDLPALPTTTSATTGPVRLVLTGGAAQVAGPWSRARRHGLAVGSLDTALRDPDDRLGNLRRVLAALDDAEVPHEVPMHVRVPGPPTPSGVELLDTLAERGLLALDPAGEHLEAWVDAALDHEVGVSLVGGAPADAVAAVLVAARLWGDEGDVAAGRRWVRAWLTEDLDGAVHHLEGLA